MENRVVTILPYQLMFGAEKVTLLDESGYVSGRYAFKAHNPEALIGFVEDFREKNKGIGLLGDLVDGLVAADLISEVVHTNPTLDY